MPPAPHQKGKISHGTRVFCQQCSRPKLRRSFSFGIAQHGLTTRGIGLDCALLIGTLAMRRLLAYYNDTDRAYYLIVEPEDRVGVFAIRLLPDRDEVVDS